jgi:hypothetical protein
LPQEERTDEGRVAPRDRGHHRVVREDLAIQHHVAQAIARGDLAQRFHAQRARRDHHRLREQREVLARAERVQQWLDAGGHAIVGAGPPPVLRGHDRNQPDTRGELELDRRREDLLQRFFGERAVRVLVEQRAIERRRRVRHRGCLPRGDGGRRHLLLRAATSDHETQDQSERQRKANARVHGFLLARAGRSTRQCEYNEGTGCSLRAACQRPRNPLGLLSNRATPSR